MVEGDELAGFGGAVDAGDELDGATAFLAGDHGGAVFADGVGKLGELSAVAFAGDGQGIGAAASHVFAFAVVDEDLVVCWCLVGKLPADDAVVFDADGAIFAGDFESSGEAWGAGGAGGEGAHGAVGKADDGGDGVFHFDVVDPGLGKGVDGDGIAHEHEELVDDVDALVHEGAAAVEFPGAAPAAVGVVFRGAEPVDMGVGEEQTAEATLADGLQDALDAAAEAHLKDAAEDDVVVLAGIDDGIGALEGNFEGFFAEDVFAVVGGLDGEFEPGAAGGGENDGIDVISGEQVIEALSVVGAELLSEVSGAFGYLVVDSGDVAALDVADCLGVHIGDAAGADDAESDLLHAVSAPWWCRWLDESV